MRCTNNKTLKENEASHTWQQMTELSQADIVPIREMEPKQKVDERY